MHHSLVQRSAEQMTGAPVVVERKISLDATPDEAFAVLADHRSWPQWFKGMHKAQVDGAPSGAGALRTVWVGPAHVQEQFVAWRPGRRLTFDVVETNLRGVLAMQEDWSLQADGPDRSTLTIRVTAEPSGPLRAAPWLLRWILRRATRGAAGLADVFRRPRQPQHLASTGDLVGVGVPAIR